MIRRNGMSAVVLLVFVVLAAGSVQTDDAVEQEVESSSSSTEVIRTSATELFAAFDANKVAADAQYEGKILEVSGTVDSIGKDIMDSMYVALESGNPILGVQCFFADSHQDTLSSLSKGQNVTIRGKCDGSMGNVILRGCVLAD